MDRITEVTRDCLDALIQVRRLPPGSLPDAVTLQRQLRAFVDAAYGRAAQQGFSREDAHDIVYPLVALADEIILSRSEELRDAWARDSLQLHYFHENVAGEAFFTRLATVRRDPHRQEVLRVYYLALILGFRGRFQVRGGELELMTLVEELQHELARAARFDAEILSPHGERPEEARAGRRGGGVILWIAAGILGLTVLVYTGLRLSLEASAGDALQRIAAVEPR